MADKTVNVNIKYNVDVSAVQKAEASTQRAQVATDNLRKSADQFAKQFQTNTVKSTDTIAGLTLKMQQLKAQIELTSLTDTKRLSLLSGQYKAIQSQVDAYNKSLLTQNKVTKEAATESQSLASQFQNVYSAVKLLLAAGLAKEIVSTTLEMAKLSGNVEAVDRAFKKQIPNAVGLLADLRKATQNSVTDLELMQKALQAQNFGIDVQRLPELLEFAAIRAQQTGVSVDYLVNSIVTGIGRKSILILDNLGISATRLKAEFDGAAVASKSVGDVTNAVADIAKEEMAKMGGYVQTAATEVDQLTTAWQELRVEVSKTVTEGPAGGITAVLRSYVDSFKALFEAINRGVPVQDVFAEKQRILIAQASANEFLNRRQTKNREENIKIVEEEIAALTKSIGSWARFRDEMEKNNAADQIELDTKRKSFNANQDEIIALAQGIKFRKDLINAKKEETLIDQEILKLLQGRLIAFKQVNKETEKSIELRDKILGKDTLSETKKPTKEPFVQRVVNNQELVDTQKLLQDAIDRLGLIVTIPVKPGVPPYQDSDFQKAWEENMVSVRESAINNTNDIIQSELQAEVDAYTMRIQMARDFYDEQVELAGDNERVKKEIRIREDRELQKLEKERADRERRSVLAGILTNTALAIIKIFAGEGTYADKIIRAAIMAGEGATQYAIASRARYYNKGEINIKGPGTETSDSIPAMLSKGESIMTAKQTREAFGILNDVRAGRLNDKVLRQLVSNGGSQMVMDDSRIVNAIKGQPRPPDLVRQGKEIYEVYTLKEGHKRYIRSKSMG